MILQSLYDYYQRKVEEGDPDIAVFGFEKKEIPFIIELNNEGHLIQIEDTRKQLGKKKLASAYFVPQGVKKAAAIATNLLWDNVEYVLGLTLGKKEQQAQKELDKTIKNLEASDYPNPDDSSTLLEKLTSLLAFIENNKPAEIPPTLVKSLQKQQKILNRVNQQHQAFIDKLKNQQQAILDDNGVKAVLNFLESFDTQSLKDHPLYEDLKTNPNITFRLQRDKDLICQRKAIITSLQTEKTEQKNTNTCLITGEQAEIGRLHTAIKGVWDAHTAGANIISFNHHAFTSFGKKQGDNAPIGEKAIFAYTTAINHLLRKDSPQRVQVGDTSTVFWAEKQTKLETLMPSFFGFSKDKPDAGTNAVKSLYQSYHHGKLNPDEANTGFHVLGLAPNGARISIRFWQTSTVKEMADLILQHFEDISIIHHAKQSENLPLFILLISTATQGKADNISPNIAGETIRSILTGMPYPKTLLTSVIRRIRAEQSKKDKAGKSSPNVTYPRAALIKACLNRQLRYNNPEKEEILQMSLDKENTNIGYRLGRLFATLEKIQEEANPNLNATIRDRYYGAASSTPVTVFSTLLKLKNHHLSKMSNKGRVTNLEKLMGEIMEEITDFPPNLDLSSQGRFSIGYYHQRQDFF